MQSFIATTVGKGSCTENVAEMFHHAVAWHLDGRGMAGKGEEHGWKGGGASADPEAGFGADNQTGHPNVPK